MDPAILIIIAAIVVTVLAIDLYKRQNERVTSNLHADNLKQLLTISALESRLRADVSKETEPQSALNEITRLISCYERGEIPAETFQEQMDCLLNKYN